MIWPDWYKNRIEPLLYAWFPDVPCFIFDYAHAQGCYVVLPKYPPLRVEAGATLFQAKDHPRPTCSTRPST